VSLISTSLQTLKIPNIWDFGSIAMHIGKLVFSQIIDYLPMHTFRRCVVWYNGNRYKKTFSCLDQFLCMAFAQLTYQ
jgi:hypothetical protein